MSNFKKIFCKKFLQIPSNFDLFSKKKKKKKTQPLRNICTFPPEFYPPLTTHSLYVYLDLLRFEVGAMMTIVGCHNSI